MTDSNGLLDAHEMAELGPPEAVRLPLDLVDPSPDNPRQTLPEIPELADNIRRFGLLQPISVRRQGARYELMGGHRRRLAFLMLAEQFPLEPQWRTIPAVVRTADDAEANLMLISAQVHNRAWKMREEAAALEHMKLSGMTLRQIGDALNKTEAWASKRLRVYADSVLSGFVQTGRLNTSVAELLLSVKDPKVRQEMAERAAVEGWAPLQTQAALRNLAGDRSVSQIGQLAQSLLELLASVQSTEIPDETALVLNSLRRRIMTLSRAPVIPSIEAARAAAGISDKPSRRRKPLGYRPGYKPRTG